jgi:3-hydroxyisobutyrate dehydrogenase-like beta-hydroxyacid dehydrogenase
VQVAAWDILAGSPAGAALAARAAAIGTAFHERPGPAVAGADLVISAVTAASSLAAAEAVAPNLEPGQVLFDINSVSAARKRATAAVVRARTVAYVDMAVMAPVHPRAHRTPTLVAGDLAGRAEGLIAALGFAAETVGPEPGAATTIKMIRSLFVKGVEALAVQALAAAAAAGCYERVNGSLRESYDGIGWDRLAGYPFERVARHGIRRAAEMRESAEAFRELGFAEGADLAAAVAALQQAVGQAGIDPEASRATGEAAAAVAAALLGRDTRAAPLE